VVASGVVTEIGYDGDGARVWQTSGVTTTVYVGDLMEVTIAPGVHITRTYYYAGGQQAAVRRGGVLHYLHGDHGSSPKGELLGSLAAPNCTWAPPPWPRTPVARR